MTGGYGDIFMATVAKYIQLHTSIVTQLFNFQQSIVGKLVRSAFALKIQLELA